MWLIIIIGIIGFILILFYSDRKKERQDIARIGGMKTRYHVLVEYLLSYPNPDMKLLTGDRIEISSKRSDLSQYFIILHAFKNVVIICNSTHKGKELKEKWEFLNSIDQTEMIKKIQNNIEFKPGIDYISSTDKEHYFIPKFTPSPQITTHESSSNVFVFPGTTLIVKVFNDFLSMSIPIFDTKYTKAAKAVKQETFDVGMGVIMPAKTFIFQGDELGALEFFVYFTQENTYTVSYTKVNDNMPFDLLLEYFSENNDFSVATRGYDVDCDIKFTYSGHAPLPMDVKKMWVQLDQVQENVVNVSLWLEKLDTRSTASRLGLVLQA